MSLIRLYLLVLVAWLLFHFWPVPDQRPRERFLPYRDHLLLLAGHAGRLSPDVGAEAFDAPLVFKTAGFAEFPLYLPEAQRIHIKLDVRHGVHAKTQSLMVKSDDSHFWKAKPVAIPPQSVQKRTYVETDAVVGRGFRTLQISYDDDSEVVPEEDRFRIFNVELTDGKPITNHQKYLRNRWATVYEIARKPSSYCGLCFTLVGILALGVFRLTLRDPVGALGAVMISIPLSYKSTSLNTPMYFLTEILLVPFLARVFWTLRQEKTDLMKSPFWHLTPFVFFLALSTLWANHKGMVGKEVIRWAEFMALGLVVPFVAREKISRIATILANVGCLVAITGTLEFLFLENQNPYRPGAEAFFGHPNPTAAFISLCAFPVLGFLFEAGRGQLLRWGSLLVILLLGLAFTFSRGVFLASAIGSLLFFFWISSHRFRPNRRLVIFFVPILVFFGLFLGVEQFRDTTIARLVTKPFLEEREPIFKLGWKTFLSRPLLGLGAGNMKDYALRHDIRLSPETSFATKVGDLHNLFLQLAVETGVIGLGLFLWGLFKLASFFLDQARHIRDTPQAPLFYALSAGSLAFLMGNMTSVFTVKGIHLEWAVLLGLQVAIARTGARSMSETVVREAPI